MDYFRNNCKHPLSNPFHFDNQRFDEQSSDEHQTSLQRVHQCGIHIFLSSLGVFTLLTVAPSVSAQPLNFDDLVSNSVESSQGLLNHAAQVGYMDTSDSYHPWVSNSGGSSQTSSATLLFVNPVTGNDTTGDGSQRSPLRTLTRALDRAQPGHTIMLASGTYSVETGEQFPIRLMQGVTVHGDPSIHGRGIVIQGGGDFISPTATRQNIAVLGANQATLTGVTVTNPNHRGYGVWIESTSPLILGNTLTENVHDGVSVNGISAPLILRNRFAHNGANGITVYGQSNPRIEENLFEQTGYGINVAEAATPMIVNNRLFSNRSGIVAQEQTRLVLRGNIFTNNQHHGVVAIAQTRVDLGTISDPGKNEFSGNGLSDINAESAEHEILAIGNQLEPGRVLGSVNVNGQALNQTQVESAVSETNNPDAQMATISVSAESAPDRVEPEIVQPETIATQYVNAPTQNEYPATAQVAVAQPTPFPQPNAAALVREPAPWQDVRAINEFVSPEPSQPNPVVQSSRQLSGSQPSSIPQTSVPSRPIEPPIQVQVISFEGSSTQNAPPFIQTAIHRSAASGGVTPQAYSQNPVPAPINQSATTTSLPGSIPIRVIAPPSMSSPTVASGGVPVQVQTAIPTTRVMNRPEEVLAVPIANVPHGYVGDRTRVSVGNNPLGNQLGIVNHRASLRYRVVVDGSSQSLAKIQSLVPGAFQTWLNGRSLIQVGAFASLENANEVAQLLARQGIRSEIQPMN